MFLKNSLISLFILLAFIGCSKKPETSAKLVVGHSFAFASGAGGLMLYIHNKAIGSISAEPILDTTKTITLVNGAYDFRVVGWNGSAPFDGNLICGATSALLEGGDVVIDIIANAATCNSDIFAPAANRDDASGLLPLKLITCSSLTNVTAASSTCNTTEKGNSGSYRLRLVPHLTFAGEIPSFTEEGLKSVCLPATGGTNGTTQLSFKVPYGNPQENFAMVVESYTDTNCAAGLEVFFFPHGLGLPSLDPARTKGFAGATTNVYLHHSGVALRGDATFSDRIISQTEDKAYTVFNNSLDGIFGLTAEVVGGGGFITFKGGAFPGIGGSCGPSVAGQSSCTIVLKFTPVSAGVTSASLALAFTDNFGKPKSVSLDVSGKALNPAFITLAPAGDHNFGDVINSLPQNRVYTISNNGDVPATSVLPAVAGGPTYGLLSTTCAGGTLAPNAECYFIVRVAPTQYGDFNSTVTVTYNDGIIAKNTSVALSARGVMTGTMGAHYSNAPNWNDYVHNNNSSSLFTDNNTACVPLIHTSCHHAGELRKVIMPSEFSTCAGWNGSDSLGVFEWECAPEGGDVVFRSRSFKKGKGLRDLLDPGTWKNIEFRVTDGAGKLSFITTNLQWWTNPVYNLDSVPRVIALPYTIPGAVGKDAKNDLTGTFKTVELNIPSAIYVLSTSRQLKSFYLGADKVAVVTIGAGTFRGDTVSGTKTCNALGGNVQVLDGSDVSTLFCSNSNHLWLEVKAESGGGNAIYLGNSRFSTIHGSHLSKGTAGANIRIKGAAKPILIRDSSTYSNQFGIDLINSSYVTIANTEVHKVTAAVGIQLNNSTNNVLHNVTLSNSNRGLEIVASSHDNKISNLLMTQNSYTTNGAFYVDNSRRLTVTHSTFANNKRGIQLAANGQDHTFANVITTNTISSNAGLEILGSSNSFHNLVASHNDINIFIGTNAINNVITGLKTAGPTTADCSVHPGNGNAFSNITNGSPLANGNQACPASIAGDLTNSFLGKALSDAQNAHSAAITNGGGLVAFNAITDFKNFINPFRIWGNPGASGTPISDDTAGSCLLGSCVPWDWRIDSGDTVLLDQPGVPFVAGGACPIDGNDSIIDENSIPNTFLLNAYETVDDGIGDEDGLCESNEECIYAPNIGVFQGEGPIVGACIFTDGTVVGVTLRAFSSFSGTP